MFVRKKKNRSGTVSVVVADKSSGRFKELKTVGVSSDPDEISRLEVKARQWIDEYSGQLALDFDESTLALQEAKNTISRIERTLQNTPQVILGHIYDRIGFGAIGDGILRHLAIARVCQPQSKAATVAYLKSYFDEDVQLHNIYRYMDKLYNTQREEVQRISVEHTMKILGGRIGVVFYDVTTLYFESAPQPDDELRQAGFSKDGKMSESQIVLGLLVSEGGYPMSYSIFNGSQAVSINEEKIAEDSLWDGLKGYITNTNLSGKEVVSQYHRLWVVERAFRIGKGTLEMRPMFHFTEKRIEAHICICFVAYKVYKELERVIRELNMNMSVDKALEIAKTITTLRIRLPNGSVYTETLFTTPQQEAIKPLLEAFAIDKLK